MTTEALERAVPGQMAGTRADGAPLKVLHVIATLAARYGGPSKACLEMAQAVAALGHEVSIYTTNVDGPGVSDVPLDRPVHRKGVEIHHFPIQRPRFWRVSWPMAAALERAIPEVDVVHVHTLYMFHDWVVGRHCRRFGVPYLLRPHGTLDPYIYRRHRWRKRIVEWLYQDRVLREATAIHYTTEEEQELATPYVHGAPGTVVPLGLHLADYDRLPDPTALARRYPECAGRKVILFFGRLNFKKGLDLLTEAFGRILRERSDVHLLLVGPDGGMRAQTEAWLRANGTLEQATFTDMLLGEAKLEVLAGSDLFVLPSYSENFGIAVIEAMACGLPVAAHPVQGPLDVIERGVSGILDDNLQLAVQGALELSPQAAIAHARRYSWEAATDVFFSNLAPINETGAAYRESLPGQ